jgi:uncharacterized protein (UPF0335 family)
MTETNVYDSNRLVSVMGLPKILRAVASRLENSADSDGINKELLEQAAQRIERLEVIATIATQIVSIVPYHRDHSHSSKVPRDMLIRMCDALNVEPDLRVRRIR